MCSRVASSIAMVFVLATAAQEPDPGARRVLASHVSHGIGESPFDSDVWHDPVNAALVVGARSGATTAELASLAGGERELEPRLAALGRRGFLSVDGARVRAAFPILLGDERNRYMRMVGDAAGRIDAEMRGRWEALVREIASRGWAEWSYHFVWSQTMDSGFTWSPMMEQGLVPPLSRLIVWVVYPAHPFKSGTNYYPDTELRDQMIAVTWRPRAANTVARVGSAWRAIWSAAVAGQTTGEERRQLADLGLAGEGGRIRVPVVRKGDALYSRLETLGAEHVRLVAAHLPLADLRALTGADDRVTFAMAYHDVSWDILGRLVERGAIVPPPALRPAAPDTVSMAGVPAVVDAHPGFIRELKKALGIR